MNRIKLLVLLSILTFTISCGQQKRYVSYKTKKGETMRDIANKFDIKTKDLLRLNPDVGRKPEENTTIIVPNPNKEQNQIAKNATATVTPKKKEVPIDTVEQKSETAENAALKTAKKNFVVHVVKPKETVYGLTHFYNISPDDLFMLNPSIKSEGLKIGQIIRIKPTETETETEENSLFEDNFKAEATINLALLLPFRANQHASKSPSSIFEDNKLANIVTDFYMGSEIAIDSIRKQGVTVNVQVFDTNRKGSRINAILADEKLAQSDVIIGPFYSEEATKVAKNVKAPVIFPMYSKHQDKFSSSKLVKTAPSKINYEETLINYLVNHFNGENIIIVGDNTKESNAKIARISNKLQQHDSIYKAHVLKPEKGYIKKERFTKIMKPKTHSWVIVISDDNAIVADALNSMISLPERVTAQVFTLEKNDAFDKIDNNKLARINFTYITDEYIDENTQHSMFFNKKYELKNNTLPSSYATKGFDITYDILARLASSDNNLKETFKNGSSYRLVSKFDYDKQLFGATSNKGLFIVRYNGDLSLTRLR
ncbi:amino acid ABC transporter substrate-binding protein [Tenacibaculum maritimum]|uniref:amino acid ABC transporter substrate-binding protein n=1 Tax=Tenacibaculum maritimum TaxID=107401 RepID=UPI0012E624CF|nr:LysM domain-containing protein [Tenacibaculum maritimum]CAA0199945.1 CBM50-containing protein, family CBM50 [Tenacibaculum maritimum]